MKKINSLQKLFLLITFCFVISKFNFVIAQNGCFDICNERIFLPQGTMNCGNFTVTFEDPFNDGTLNTAAWRTHYACWPLDINGDFDWCWGSRSHGFCEDQFYMDSNVVEENGILRLIGRNETEAFGGQTETGFHTETRQITSGMIESIAGYNFSRFTFRFRFPSINGWWPAIWLFHGDEIDLVEAFTSNNLPTQYNFYPIDTRPECDIRFLMPNLGDNQWHTVSLTWTPFLIEMNVDNQPIGEPIYRFFHENGTPLIVNCVNNVIPEGHYILNPSFPQVAGRVFHIICNLASINRCGGADPNNNPNNCCVETGNYVKDNCNPVCDAGSPNFPADFPAEINLDFITVENRNYWICPTIGLRYELGPYCFGPNNVYRINTETIGTDGNFNHLVNNLGATTNNPNVNVNVQGREILFFANQINNSNLLNSVINITYIDQCDQTRAINFPVIFRAPITDYFSTFYCNDPYYSGCDHFIEINSRIDDDFLCTENTNSNVDISSFGRYINFPNQTFPINDFSFESDGTYYICLTYQFAWQAKMTGSVSIVFNYLDICQNQRSDTIAFNLLELCPEEPFQPIIEHRPENVQKFNNLDILKEDYNVNNQTRPIFVFDYLGRLIACISSEDQVYETLSNNYKGTVYFVKNGNTGAIKKFLISN